jgi:hypothetical protein
MLTFPIVRVAGTGCSGAASRTEPALSLSKGVSAPPELSQNFFTVLFYLRSQNKAPAEARAEFRVCLSESANIL